MYNKEVDYMNEKKRERLIKVFRVLALIMAVIMVLGVVFNPF